MPAGTLTRGPAARLALPAAGLCMLFVSLGVHLYKYPDFSGFWAGVDQQRYLDSARAWAAFDVSLAKHHYLPLYPLLGAAFVWLTPWQPLMLPDAACWVASLLIFVRIGKRLASDWPPAIPAACFLVAELGGRTLAAIWVVPWSTTGSAPWQFAAILLALRLGERSSAGRAAALGAAIAVVAGFRPSDAAPVAGRNGGSEAGAGCQCLGGIDDDKFSAIDLVRPAMRDLGSFVPVARIVRKPSTQPACAGGRAYDRFRPRVPAG